MLTAGVGKWFYLRFKFNSTCCNTVERGGGVGEGRGGGGKRFNVAVQQNRTDVEENVDRAFKLPI